MNKPLFRAALVTTVLSASMMSAGVASAASVAVADGRGDVWASTWDDQTESETIEPANSGLNVDVVRTVVKHTAQRLVITARYDELRKSENRFALYAKVRTNEGVKREVGVETFSRWGGTPFFGKPNGDEVRCKGLSHAIDYATNTVSVSVPRTCLSGPRWVQAATGALGFPDVAGSMTTYLDNGHDDSADEPNTWTARVRRG